MSEVSSYSIYASAHTVSGQLSDGTKLSVELCDESVNVELKGTISGVADATEQLAWLGAACRTCPSAHGLACSKVDIRPKHSLLSTYSIEYQLENIETVASKQNGACWHGLFRNPVVVPGFLILARRYGERGLEIPLNMMAHLGEADRATMFGDQLLIKGFSVMFVPTLRTPDSVLWHFLFDRENVRIPLPQPRIHAQTEPPLMF